LENINTDHALQFPVPTATKPGTRPDGIPAPPPKPDIPVPDPAPPPMEDPAMRRFRL